MNEEKSRSKEKHEFWWKKFRHKDVIAVFKKRLFELFNNQCFRCGTTGRLHIDHHLPRIMGGRLEAGNLVVLCSRCNNAKGTISPDVFYSEKHLALLSPLLERQREIFAFHWDWDFYNRDRVGYFLSLGVDPKTAERIFHDPLYEGYMGPRSEGLTNTLEITEEMIRAAIAKLSPPPTSQSQ
jgi:HNH endonuclease